MPNDAEQQITATHDTRTERVRKLTRLDSKCVGVLNELMARGRKGLNRFEAIRLCADYVLPSTISELCADFGLEIPRILETVRGHQGRLTDCMRYKLSDSDRAKVRKLLGLEPEAKP